MNPVKYEKNIMNPKSGTCGDSRVFEGLTLRSGPPQGTPSKNQCCIQGMDHDGSPCILTLDEEVFSRHILILGNIGTGKTNGLLQLVNQIRKQLIDQDCMIIFDTKGDYYRAFYREGDMVISNDDRAIGASGKKDYWNIFGEVGKGEQLEPDLQEIASTLFFDRMTRSQQPFFPAAARDLFAGILLHLLRRSAPKIPHNAALREFLDQATASSLRSMLSQHPDLAAFCSYIQDDHSPQTQGVISELQQISREVLVGNFRKAGSLSIREAIRRKDKSVIFVEYDLGIGTVLSPIYRLMLDLAIKETLCRTSKNGNVWFIVDEFRLLPNLQHIDDGLNFGRSLGAKFLLGIQNVEQIYHSYGEQRARSILAGCSTIISFRVNDAASRLYLQGVLGKNRKLESYMASVASRGIVEQIREAFVVEDWEISPLPPGTCIVNKSGFEPYYFTWQIWNGK